MIELRNLAFAYGTKRVLTDVSFVVSPGEIVSVVGANGAGKTTLLRLMANLELPDGGLLLYDGRDALSRPLKYRRQVGFLPEHAALCEDMKVRDYLAYRAELKGEMFRRVRRRVDEAVELCRLGTVQRTPIRLLSQGWRKRVALADAMLLRPRVLLLDDFLAGLDLEMRDAMGEILSDAAAFSSVVVTGHELDDFIRWTTRFVVLRDGRVTAVVPTSGSDRADLRAHLEDVLKGGLG